MKKIFAVIVSSLIFLGGCGVDMDDYVTKEEYDLAIEQKDDLQNEVNELKEEVEEANTEISNLKSDDLENVKKMFSDTNMYDDTFFMELQNGNDKSLEISIRVKINDGNVSENFSEIGGIIGQIANQKIYDYVFVNVWNESAGLIGTMQLDLLSGETKSYMWYGEN